MGEVQRTALWLILGKTIIGQQLQEEHRVEDVLKDKRIHVFIVFKNLSHVVSLLAARRVWVFNWLDGPFGLFEMGHNLFDEHRILFLNQYWLLVLLILNVFASSLLHPQFYGRVVFRPSLPHEKQLPSIEGALQWFFLWSFLHIESASKLLC